MEKLETSIYEQLGSDSIEEYKQTLKDVCRGGANAGFSGFTYSHELLEFYETNRDEILSELKELASDLGNGGLIEMIQGFNCLKGTDLTEDEIAVVIYEKNYSGECARLIVDALCWAVLENVAFRYDC